MGIGNARQWGFYQTHLTSCSSPRLSFLPDKSRFISKMRAVGSGCSLAYSGWFREREAQGHRQPVCIWSTSSTLLKAFCCLWDSGLSVRCQAPSRLQRWRMRVFTAWTVLLVLHWVPNSLSCELCRGKHVSGSKTAETDLDIHCSFPRSQQPCWLLKKIALRILCWKGCGENILFIYR